MDEIEIAEKKATPVTFSKQKKDTPKETPKGTPTKLNNTKLKTDPPNTTISETKTVKKKELPPDPIPQETKTVKKKELPSDPIPQETKTVKKKELPPDPIPETKTVKKKQLPSVPIPQIAQEVLPTSSSDSTEEMTSQEILFYTSNDKDTRELASRRSRYKCGSNFIELKEIETWHTSLKKLHNNLKLIGPSTDDPFIPSSQLNKKVSLWQGDITQLEIDAIVNAAKTTLLGGGGIDGAIHKAAGKGLINECKMIGGCPPGHCRITSGYKLPAKYVIHTVGPTGEIPPVLKACYKSVLRKIVKKNLKVVAFCCISTGIYGYPNEAAAHVALKTIRKWLEKDDNDKKIERIIFCIYLMVDFGIYQKLMQSTYFPG
jgi:O-acetyl-ADP-ribose deacetylase (regulator of RNase III)